MFFASLLHGQRPVAGEALFWRPKGSSSALLVARTGEAAPGVAGLRITRFTGASLPGSAIRTGAAGPVFAVRLQGANARQTADALYAVNSSGEVQLLARTGTVVNGKTLRSIGAFPYFPRSTMQARTAAASAQVIYLAGFDDGSTTIIKLDIP